MSNSITKPKIYKHTTLLDEDERVNLEKIARIKNLNMSDIVRDWIKKEIKKINKGTTNE